jgi:hypothetical protein
MKSLLLLYSASDEAAAEALALSQNGWNVVVTGPNEGTEIRQDDQFVAKLASSWAVFASKQPLSDPNG